MMTVGAWLHSKSNIHSWNRYMGDQMNQAIATGKLVSFALISFFSLSVKAQKDQNIFIPAWQCLMSNRATE